MKKTLIAAAVLAGFAGAAQAQSSVTLYGLIDAGYSYTKVEGQKSRNAIDSGLASESRWGLRGSEDLGNGWRANFQLESGISVDSGTTNGGLFNRQAWLGVSSAQFGELRLGRQFTLGTTFFESIDPFRQGFGQASLGSTFVANNLVRANNSAQYLSPTWGGFQAGIGYSFDSVGNETPVSGTNNRLITSGVRYNNGPISAALTYEQVEPATGGGVGKAIQIGGAYDFGVVKLHAAFADQKKVDVGAPGSIYGRDSKSWMVGASAPIGNGSLFGSYQKASKWDISGYAVGYSYNLSRRTNAYAFYSDFDNVGSRGSVANDVGSRQFGVGLRHSF